MCTSTFSSARLRLAGLSIAAAIGVSAAGPASPQTPAESGFASIYSAELQGRLTASGQPYDGQKLTAAHRTLPLGTVVRVVNVSNGRTVSVVVNDRWGGGPGRVVNLSRRAAEELGMGNQQQLAVRLEVETLGTGRAEPSPGRAEPSPGRPELPRPGGTPVREKVPDRIVVTSDDLAGRTARCRNEADILGLKDDWHENHVRNCLARKTPKRPPAPR